MIGGLVMLAWPVLAVVAVVFLVRAALVLDPARSPGRGREAWTLAARRSAIGAAAVAAATYGWGLTFIPLIGLPAETEDRCLGGDTSDTSGVWPLHDYPCGIDVVPAFVNPLIAVSTLLSVALTVVLVVDAVLLRRRRRLMGGQHTGI